jgi:hypothetical protein
MLWISLKRESRSSHLEVDAMIQSDTVWTVKSRYKVNITWVSILFHLETMGSWDIEIETLEEEH